MASGDLLHSVNIRNYEPTLLMATPATLKRVSGRHVLCFGYNKETIVIGPLFIPNNYAGGNILIDIYAFSTDVSNTIYFESYVINSNLILFDTTTATSYGISSTLPSTAGILKKYTIERVVTNREFLVGDSFFIQLSRIFGGGIIPTRDTSPNDAYVYAINVKEK